jgi:ketosteroid isomerase-like protein
LSGEENVEIIRRAFEVWNAGELDEWKEFFDRDIVVFAPEGWPDGAVTEGLDAWLLQAERLRESWAEARVEIDDIRAVEDRVLVSLRYVTRSETGLPFDTPLAAVFFFEGRKVTRARYFWKLEEALELAGLPGDSHADSA